MSRRLDYLPNHEEIKIYQDDEMFCINTDTMVLGEFLDIKKKDIVLDIGTNTGALLLYASKFKPKKLIGIDINEKALELAKENNIDIEIAQVRISEIASNLPADLIVTTSKVKRDFGVPLITGMPFVSGLGVDKTKARILEVLNK